MQVCAKLISSVRKVLSIAKVNMFLGIVLGGASSVPLTAGVSLVSILWMSDWPRVCTAGRHYFAHI